MARVCRPGGTVLIVNHFGHRDGALAFAQRLAAALADLLGWHSSFDRARVLGESRLALEEEQILPPLDKSSGTVHCGWRAIDPS